MYATFSFAPPGLAVFSGGPTHGLRRGLHSSAASRLPRLWPRTPIHTETVRQRQNDLPCAASRLPRS